MLRRIPKLLLLVALLSAFVASSIPAFGDSVCICNTPFRKGPPGDRCHFDKNISQCINTSCPGICLQIVP